MSSTDSLFEQAGGEAGLLAVIRDFYDAVFDDLMIGFFFRGADKQRLIRLEYELTAAALGAEVAYTGRALDAAHAPHRIFGGQFERRKQLLREAMAAHDLPQPVREAWLAHSESLRAQVTSDRGSDCDA